MKKLVCLLAFALFCGVRLWAASADLVRSDTVRKLLNLTDYHALLAAQDKERPVADMVKAFAGNYRAMASLAGEYENCDSMAQASALQRGYDSLAKVNKNLSDNVATLWGSIFDNKSYSYNFILDKLNQSALLSSFQDRSQQVAALNNSEAGQFISDDIARYHNEKGLLVDYERDVAKALGLKAALDSLMRVRAELDRADFNFPPIELSQKSFINYAPAKLGTVPVYGIKNPIPKCTVYDSGTIYRILIGTFPVAQPTSIFKGLSPMATIGEKGKYSYYAGGYPTLRAALEGLAVVKKAVIRGAKPEVVVWQDGHLRNISDESAKAAAKGTKFNIEISGTYELPQGLLDAVKKGSKADVTRSATKTGEPLFIISPLETLIDARLMAETLAAQAPALTIEVK